MLRLLVFLYLLVEIVALVFIGNAIGAVNTVLLLIAASLIGGWLLRKQVGGAIRAARARSQSDLAADPRSEVSDGVSLALASVLVVIPGFVTSVLGVLLLIPAVRRSLRPLIETRIAALGSRAMRTAGAAGYGSADQYAGRQGPRVIIVDGSIPGTAGPSYRASGPGPGPTRGPVTSSATVIGPRPGHPVIEGEVID